MSGVILCGGVESCVYRGNWFGIDGLECVILCRDWEKSCGVLIGLDFVVFVDVMVGCFVLIWLVGFLVFRCGGEFECGVVRYFKLFFDLLVFCKEFVEMYNRFLLVVMLF